LAAHPSPELSTTSPPGGSLCEVRGARGIEHRSCAPPLVSHLLQVANLFGHGPRHQLGISHASPRPAPLACSTRPLNAVRQSRQSRLRWCFPQPTHLPSKGGSGTRAARGQPTQHAPCQRAAVTPRGRRCGPATSTVNLARERTSPTHTLHSQASRASATAPTSVAGNALCPSAATHHAQHAAPVPPSPLPAAFAVAALQPQSEHAPACRGGPASAAGSCPTSRVPVQCSDRCATASPALSL